MGVLYCQDATIWGLVLGALIFESFHQPPGTWHTMALTWLYIPFKGALELEPRAFLGTPMNILTVLVQQALASAAAHLF